VGCKPLDCSRKLRPAGKGKEACGDPPTPMNAISHLIVSRRLGRNRAGLTALRGGPPLSPPETIEAIWLV
jgi:hypothetical protein